MSIVAPAEIVTGFTLFAPSPFPWIILTHPSTAKKPLE